MIVFRQKIMLWIFNSSQQYNSRINLLKSFQEYSGKLSVYFAVKLFFTLSLACLSPKSCLSPHIKLMINETKNTSMNGALMKAVKNHILQLF